MKYGELTSKEFNKLPDELNKEDLNEITIYPLLNYLTALSYTRGKIAFSVETNINEVYDDLIDQVFDRKYSSTKTHKTLQKITKEEFLTLLEEIAISAWHRGSQRTTTTEDIKKRCEDMRIGHLLEKFSELEEARISNLLIAFYFQQHSKKDEFLFTHKSFCEYFIARRIVRQLDEMLPEKEEAALIKWIILCGKRPLNKNNFKFICNEIKSRSKRENEKHKIVMWQKKLCELISYMLREGIPFECIPRVKYKEECEQSINAETALLAVLSACSTVTGKVSNIAWKNETVAGEWISKLFGQINQPLEEIIFRSDVKPLVRQCLHHISFKRQCMLARDLITSDLNHSDLSIASLRGAVLRGADLCGAVLRGANLCGADLAGANLNGAYMDRACLLETNLSRAIMIEAELPEAYLRKAVLCRADLSRAVLRGVILSRADLHRAILCGADLSRAVLYEANLRKADLNGAILYKTNLRVSNIRGINLNKVDLRDSEIYGIKYDQSGDKLGVNGEILKKYGRYMPN